MSRPPGAGIRVLFGVPVVLTVGDLIRVPADEVAGMGVIAIETLLEQEAK